MHKSDFEAKNFLALRKRNLVHCLALLPSSGNETYYKSLTAPPSSNIVEMEVSFKTAIKPVTFTIFLMSNNKKK